MPSKLTQKWTKLRDMPPTMVLDGMRIRYKKRVLGYIRSGWGRGLWLTEEPREWATVQPWFPPDGKTLADIADDLEVQHHG